jgi:hypothetical protein
MMPRGRAGSAMTTVPFGQSMYATVDCETARRRDKHGMEAAFVPRDEFGGGHVCPEPHIP